MTVEIYSGNLNGIIVTRTHKVGGDDAVMLQLPGSPLQIRVTPSGDDTSGSGVAEARAALNAVNGNFYALAGNNGGIVSATDTRTVNGHVWLTTGGGVALAAAEKLTGDIKTAQVSPTRRVVAAKYSRNTRLAGLN